MTAAYNNMIKEFTVVDDGSVSGNITLRITPQYAGITPYEVTFPASGWDGALATAKIGTPIGDQVPLILYPGDIQKYCVIAAPDKMHTEPQDLRPLDGTTIEVSVPLGKLIWDENENSGRIDIHYAKDDDTKLIDSWAMLTLIAPQIGATSMSITGRVMQGGHYVAKVVENYPITKSVTYDAGTSTYPTGKTTVTINGVDIEQTFSERLTNTITSDWTADWKKTVDIKVSAGDVTMATAQRVIDASDVYQKGVEDGSDIEITADLQEHPTKGMVVAEARGDGTLINTFPAALTLTNAAYTKGTKKINVTANVGLNGLYGTQDKDIDCAAVYDDGYDTGWENVVITRIDSTTPIVDEVNKRVTLTVTARANNGETKDLDISVNANKIYNAVTIDTIAKQSQTIASDYKSVNVVVKGTASNANTKTETISVDTTDVYNAVTVDSITKQSQTTAANYKSIDVVIKGTASNTNDKTETITIDATDVYNKGVEDGADIEITSKLRENPAKGMVVAEAYGDGSLIDFYPAVLSLVNDAYVKGSKKINVTANVGNNGLYGTQNKEIDCTTIYDDGYDTGWDDVTITKINSTTPIVDDVNKTVSLTVTAVANNGKTKDMDISVNATKIYNAVTVDTIAKQSETTASDYKSIDVVVKSTASNANTKTETLTIDTSAVYQKGLEDGADIEITAKLRENPTKGMVVAEAYGDGTLMNTFPAVLSIVNDAYVAGSKKIKVTSNLGNNGLYGTQDKEIDCTAIYNEGWDNVTITKIDSTTPIVDDVNKTVSLTVTARAANGETKDLDISVNATKIYNAVTIDTIAKQSQTIASDYKSVDVVVKGTASNANTKTETISVDTSAIYQKGVEDGSDIEITAKLRSNPAAGMVVAEAYGNGALMDTFPATLTLANDAYVDGSKKIKVTANVGLNGIYGTQNKEIDCTAVYDDGYDDGWDNVVITKIDSTMPIVDEVNKTVSLTVTARANNGETKDLDISVNANKIYNAVTIDTIAKQSQTTSADYKSIDVVVKGTASNANTKTQTITVDATDIYEKAAENVTVEAEEVLSVAGSIVKGVAKATGSNGATDTDEDSMTVTGDVALDSTTHMITFTPIVGGTKVTNTYSRLITGAVSGKNVNITVGGTTINTVDASSIYDDGVDSVTVTATETLTMTGSVVKGVSTATGSNGASDTDEDTMTVTGDVAINATTHMVTFTPVVGGTKASNTYSRLVTGAVSGKNVNITVGGTAINSVDASSIYDDGVASVTVDAAASHTRSGNVITFTAKATGSNGESDTATDSVTISSAIGSGSVSGNKITYTSTATIAGSSMTGSESTKTIDVDVAGTVAGSALYATATVDGNNFSAKIADAVSFGSYARQDMTRDSIVGYDLTSTTGSQRYGMTAVTPEKKELCTKGNQRKIYVQNRNLYYGTLSVDASGNIILKNITDASYDWDYVVGSEVTVYDVGSEDTVFTGGTPIPNRYYGYLASNNQADPSGTWYKDGSAITGTYYKL